MVDERPPPPSEVIRLRALDARWERVIDWVDGAAAEAVAYRSAAINEACRAVPDFTKRLKLFFTIDDRYFARLAEIDGIEAQFREAYDAVRSSFNFAKVLEYASLVEPFARADDEIKEKKMRQARIDQADHTHERMELRDKRRKEKVEKRMAALARRNEELMKAKKAQDVEDE